MSKSPIAAARRLAVSLLLASGVMPAWSVPLDLGHFSYVGTFARDCSVTACGPTSFPPIVQHSEGFIPYPIFADLSTQLTTPLGVAGGEVTSAETNASGSLGLGVFSNAGSRVSANAASLRRYSYRGSSVLDIHATGELDYLQTGPNLTSGSIDANPTGAGSWLGGSVWIFRYAPGLIPVETTGPGTADRCSIAGAFGVPNTGMLFDCLPTLAGFELLDSFDIESDGSGLQSGAVDFTLSPGDSFYVFSWAQAIARFGGQFDARHTLELNFDQPELFELDTSTSVPEPATSALFTAGLAALFVLRRHRKRGMSL